MRTTALAREKVRLDAPARGPNPISKRTRSPRYPNSRTRGNRPWLLVAQTTIQYNNDNDKIDNNNNNNNNNSNSNNSSKNDNDNKIDNNNNNNNNNE